jgi:hypothetical protein
MKLPRITKVSTVEIYLKSGSKVRCDFRTFRYVMDDGTIASLRWQEDSKNCAFFVTLSEIACIVTVRTRRRIRFRH